MSLGCLSDFPFKKTFSIDYVHWSNQCQRTSEIHLNLIVLLALPRVRAAELTNKFSILCKLTLLKENLTPASHLPLLINDSKDDILQFVFDKRFFKSLWTPFNWVFRRPSNKDFERLLCNWRRLKEEELSCDPRVLSPPFSQLQDISVSSQYVVVNRRVFRTTYQ